MAHKYALLSLAGELAIEADVLPFKKGTCLNNGKTMFDEWLEIRGSDFDHEVITGKDSFFETISKHEARFQDMDAGDEKVPQNRLGFKQDYVRDKVPYRDYFVETSRIADVITTGSPGPTIKQFKTEGVIAKFDKGKSYKTGPLPGLNGRPKSYIFTFCDTDPLMIELAKAQKQSESEEK